jgi:two-component system response regulator BaeR/two-component system response regulator AdeR
LTSEVFKAGDINVNMTAFEVRCKETLIDLTSSELRLLALLAKEPNRVRYRSELLAVTGDAESFADERSVDAHIKNIRRKLGPCGEAIETVRGIGYKLRS